MHWDDLVGAVVMLGFIWSLFARGAPGASGGG